jgi:hypothetical protein
VGRGRRSVAILSHSWQGVPPANISNPLRFALGTSLARNEFKGGVVTLPGGRRRRPPVLPRLIGVRKEILAMKSVENDMRIK